MSYHQQPTCFKYHTLAPQIHPTLCQFCGKDLQGQRFDDPCPYTLFGVTLPPSHPPATGTAAAQQQIDVNIVPIMVPREGYKWPEVGTCINGPSSISPKCECGAHSIGVKQHSAWCGMKEFEG